MAARRTVALVAVVAISPLLALAGCSRDYDSLFDGAGAAPSSSSPQPGVDAGVDGAAIPPAGGEAGASCASQPNVCSPTCPCSSTCDQCTKDCQAGATCDLTCSGNLGGCNVTCRTGASCNLDCQPGPCRVTCEQGTTLCALNCRSGNCTLICPEGQNPQDCGDDLKACGRCPNN